jgi:hypothetical protein
MPSRADNGRAGDDSAETPRSPLLAAVRVEGEAASPIAAGAGNATGDDASTLAITELRPTAGAEELAAQVSDAQWFCTECGTPLAGDRFCTNCGAATGRRTLIASEGAHPMPVTQVGVNEPSSEWHRDRVYRATPPAGPAPLAPRQRRARLATLLAGGALALAAIAVVLIVLLSSSSGRSADSAYRQKLRGALAPVLAGNRSLASQLQSLSGTQTQAARSAISQAQSAVASARGALGVLTVPAASRQLAQEATLALTQESGYLEAVSATVSHPTTDTAQAQTLASTTQTALDGVAPDAGQSIGGTAQLAAWSSAQAAAATRAAAATEHKATQRIAQQAATRAAQQAATRAAQQAASSVAPSGVAGPGYGGQDLPVQCGSGVAGTAGTTCTFVENAFYEYWSATGGDATQAATISVWSALGQQWYPLTCSSGDGVVDCTGTNSSGAFLDARFTQASVAAYTSSAAAAYAASGKLGP